MALGLLAGEPCEVDKAISPAAVGAAAAGNRFWLEPYPGPFMRADVALRWRHEAADHQGGSSVPNTGGRLLTAAINWAFRPRPTVVLQLSVELPLFEDVRGIQLKHQVAAFAAFGLRF